MFIDASAIVAILARESDGAALSARLERATGIQTSPIAVYEAVLGLARAGNIAIADAMAMVDRFLEEAEVEVAPITAATAQAALRAFDRFGKGRHPAGLNLGDCFAYARARELGAPLLYKGDDFSRTDIG